MRSRYSSLATHLARPLPLVGLASLAFALACSGKDESADTNTDDSAASELHPNVPEGYEYRWDTDGCGESGTETQVYKLAEGSTDANGNFTLTETWYWFFGGSWDEDCIDVIEYTGSAVSSGTLSSLGASEAEEGYQATMTKTQDNCPGLNYLYLWDHPDKDDWEYGEGIDQNVVLIFDTLSPSGNLNFENAMLVFMGYEMEPNSYVMSYDYANGEFLPDDESNLAPPAHYTWEAGSCLDG